MHETDRRAVLRAALAGAGLSLAGSAAGQETTENGTATTTEGEDAGLVTVSGGDSAEATVERITTDIEENRRLTHVTTVRHAENAESVTMNLRPTTVIMFGNPQIGTRLMQSSQTAGIDLPQKMLVWEAEDGSVNVTYNDPAWIAERHDVDAPEMLLQQVSDALRSLATGES